MPAIRNYKKRRYCSFSLFILFGKFDANKKNKFYCGETYGELEQLRTHVKQIFAFLTKREEPHDIDFVKALTEKFFFYSHIGLPTCEIRLVRVFEQIIIHCVALLFGKNSLSNKLIGFQNDHLKLYKIDPKIDILSIGCVLLMNLLQIDLLKIDVTDRTVVPKREIQLKCPMCVETFHDFERRRPHLINGHKISMQKSFKWVQRNVFSFGEIGSAFKTSLSLRRKCRPMHQRAVPSNGKPKQTRTTCR